MSESILILVVHNTSINYFLTRCGREDNVQACRILLSYNIDPSIVSLQGYTATQISAENVLKILQGKLINLILQFILREYFCRHI